MCIMGKYSNKKSTTFENGIFNGTQCLDCSWNQLPTLPPLPDTLQELNCSYDRFITLPKLPPSLQALYLSDNRLTTLPKLPDTLQILNCSYNRVIILPELPASLTFLNCRDNNLTTLPKLPPALSYISVADNNLTTLPDLPTSLTYFEYDRNPLLEHKYPLLFKSLNSVLDHLHEIGYQGVINLQIYGTAGKVAYVNEVNSKERTIERTKQINQANILLELYMKRMMHPSRIQELVRDVDDIDAAMNAYVETL